MNKSCFEIRATTINERYPTKTMCPTCFRQLQWRTINSDGIISTVLKNNSFYIDTICEFCNVICALEYEASNLPKYISENTNARLMTINVTHINSLECELQLEEIRPDNVPKAGKVSFMYSFKQLHEPCTGLMLECRTLSASRPDIKLYVLDPFPGQTTYSKDLITNPLSEFSEFYDQYAINYFESKTELIELEHQRKFIKIPGTYNSEIKHFLIQQFSKEIKRQLACLKSKAKRYNSLLFELNPSLSTIKSIWNTV